ncbi:glycine-rich protein DOT1-like [Spodoptera litura]|uniref:Glycine-rich protein DOT1-like n=1 Tax=Spodoptera litura TaxID=69820 RepID=A0A9J7DWA4_SPOLT|nr:glycine-rich protein DOT1-like [Spodoptera litura]
MAKYIVALALLGCAMAEPPVGYSYSAPSSSISLGSLSGGGHYHSVPVGHSESEGYFVDPHLLHKIKNILLSEEIKNQEYSGGHGGHGHGHGHGISSQYGVPAPVYGVPSQKVVGIELDHVQQAIQVAQYHQAEEVYAGGHGYYSGGHGGYSSGGHGGYSSGGHGGYSSGGHGGFSSGGHGGSSHYTTIGIPSGSYGVPSESYGHPH